MGSFFLIYNVYISIAHYDNLYPERVNKYKNLYFFFWSCLVLHPLKSFENNLSQTNVYSRPITQFIISLSPLFQFLQLLLISNDYKDRIGTPFHLFLLYIQTIYKKSIFSLRCIQVYFMDRQLVLQLKSNI